MLSVWLIRKSKKGKKMSKWMNLERIDRGREYESSAFNSFVQSLEIIHETTAPYSPASNDVAERKNKTLIELANAMLIESGVPLHFEVKLF